MMATKRHESVDWPAAVGRASPIKAMSQPLEKPRGALSFLTWPFVLAQIFLVEQLLGGFVRSAAAENLPGIGVLDSAERSSEGEAEAWVSPPAQLGTSTLAETEAVTVSIGDTLGGATPQAKAPFAPARDEAYATDSMGSPIISGAGGFPGSVAVAETLESPPTSESSDVGAADFGRDLNHGQDAESVTVLLELGETMDGATGLIGGVLETTESVLRATATVLGETTDIAGALVDETIETADQLVDSGVAALNAIADGPADLTGDVLPTVEPALDAALAAPAAAIDAAIEVGEEATEISQSIVEAAQPALATAVNALGAPAERVLESGGDTETTPIEIGSGSIQSTSPVFSAQIDLGELGEDAAGGRNSDVIGSDGVIAFNDLPPLPIATDDLFVGGRYTDYGLALKTETDADSIDQLPEPVSAESTDTEGRNAEASQDSETGDTDGNTLHSGSTPAVSDLSDALDELGLRSSDGLI